MKYWNGCYQVRRTGDVFNDEAGWASHIARRFGWRSEEEDNIKKISSFWVATFNIVVDTPTFRRNLILHHQGWWMGIGSSSFMIETVGCSEAPLHTELTAWRQIVGDGSPHCQCRKNLIFYNSKCGFVRRHFVRIVRIWMWLRILLPGI